MWPRAIAQLVEVLPHVARLVPVADRFLQNRAVDDETPQRVAAAMEAVAADLRSEMGHVTASHAGILRQLTEQGAAIDEIAADLRVAKAANEAMVARMRRVEKQMRNTMTASILCVLLLVFVVVLLFAFHR